MLHQPDLLREHREPSSMMERVYRALKREIIELDRPPGTGFTEPEVARSFELSKTPVREALARLHRDGLVTPLARAGYVVAAVTLGDAADLCDMRTLLQSEAAALCAARRLDPASARRLEELSVDERDGQGSGPHFEDRIRGNYEYEAIIANGSGNSRLAMAVVDVLDELERVARLVARLTPTLPPGRTRQRVAVTEAIVTGDSEAARRAMHARGVSARKEIIDALSASPAVVNVSIPLTSRVMIRGSSG